MFGLYQESWVWAICLLFTGFFTWGYWETEINKKEKWYRYGLVFIGLKFGRKKSFSSIRNCLIIEEQNVFLHTLGPMGFVSEGKVYKAYLNSVEGVRIPICTDRIFKNVLRRINPVRLGLELNLKKGRNKNTSRKISFRGYVFVALFSILTIVIYGLTFKRDVGLGLIVLFTFVNGGLYFTRIFKYFLKRRYVIGISYFFISSLFIIPIIKLHWSYYNVFLVVLYLIVVLFFSIRSHIKLSDKAILRGLIVMNVLLISIPDNLIFQHYQVNSDRVVWKEIDWSYFHGSSPDSAQYDATIDPRILSKINRAYNYPPALILAYMLPESSSKKKGVLSKNLLKHEQGHFDLTEIYRRKAIDSVNENWSKSPNEISKIIQYFEDKLKKQQVTYDSLTDHNINQARQLTWNIYFDNQLRPRTKLERIVALEYALDSIYFDDESPLLFDSLLTLDPDNFHGNYYKGSYYMNQNEIDSAIKYLSKGSEIDPQDFFAKLYLAWCFEENGDSSKAHALYQQLLPIVPDNRYKLKIELSTIVEGPKEGLSQLNTSRDSLDEKTYLELNNDIINYSSNDGLNGFFPPYFTYIDSIEFYIKIPDEIFESGQINSMRKVAIAFAKMGINVWVKGTDSKNNGYIITTTQKYMDQLVEFDTLGLARISR